MAASPPSTDSAGDASTTDTIGVILSTYNAPLWLEKVLIGYQTQSDPDFQLFIADDGSGAATSDLIDRYQGTLPYRIAHVWHADEGFRKSTILNAAVQRASCDYLVFSDGDCIPRADFVAQHRRHRRPAGFLSGGYYKLPMPLSHAIGESDIRRGDIWDLKWLWARGLPKTPRNVRLISGGPAASVLNRLTTTRPTWNGNNSSGWRSDIVAAGGFDQRMRYGGQDRELGERLENAGVHGRHVRFQTALVHLDHARGYANAQHRQLNDAIRSRTRASGRTRTEYGLAKAA